MEWSPAPRARHNCWWKLTGGGYLQKKSKLEPVLFLVRMPHCCIRYGEAGGWQDGTLAVWNNSTSTQILHQKQWRKNPVTAAVKNVKLTYNFSWQNAASEYRSGREEWEVVLLCFKPLYQPWLQPLCMLTLADRTCSDQSTDKSVL